VNEARGIDYRLDKDGFLADRRTQQAVILNIVVIGEAATELANDHPLDGSGTDPAQAARRMVLENR